MVTRLACIAHKLQSSNKCTIKSSVASCRARRPSAVHLKGSGATAFVISRASLANGSFLMRSSVLRWYFLISLNATVPGLYLCGLETPLAVVVVVVLGREGGREEGRRCEVWCKFVKERGCCRGRNLPGTFLFPVLAVLLLGDCG